MHLLVYYFRFLDVTQLMLISIARRITSSLLILFAQNVALHIVYSHHKSCVIITAKGLDAREDASPKTRVHNSGSRQ